MIRLELCVFRDDRCLRHYGYSGPDLHGYVFCLLYSSKGSHGVKKFFKSLHHFGPGKDAVFKLPLNSGH